MSRNRGDVKPSEGSTCQPQGGPTDRIGARDAATDAIPVRYPRFMAHDSVKTAVVGAGYVGIATAVGLAEQGRNIVLVEQDPNRLAVLPTAGSHSTSRGCPRRTQASTRPAGSFRARRSRGTGWTSS